MSERMLKCYGWCEEKHAKSNLIKFSSRNYCFKCYERVTREKLERETLMHTISEVYNIPYPTGRMLKQMKDFKEERNYSYLDQSNALLYGRDVLHKVFHSKYALGLLPYIIDDSIAFHTKRDEQMENMKDITELNDTEVINKQVGGFYRDKHQKSKIIDIESELS